MKGVPPDGPAPLTFPSTTKPKFGFPFKSMVSSFNDFVKCDASVEDEMGAGIKLGGIPRVYPPCHWEGVLAIFFVVQTLNPD